MHQLQAVLAAGPGLLDSLPKNKPPTTQPTDATLADPKTLAAYGAGIYAFLVIAVFSRFGKPLWGLVAGAVVLIPWLVLNYPATWGFLVPAALWYVGWRWGWRTATAVILVGLFFIFDFYGHVHRFGWEYGLALPAALKDTFTILLIVGFGVGILRIVLGPRRADFLVGSGYHGERRRIRDREEVKKFRGWRQRKVKRASRQVKDGQPYQGAHAKPRKGKVNPAKWMDTGTSYDPDTGREFQVVGWQPDRHPDPEVRRQHAEGGAGPINGWQFDQYSGLYLEHNPATPPDRQPIPPPAPASPARHPHDDGTLVDGQPIPEYQLGGGIHHGPLWRRDP
jgi:hypothetical protein